MTTPRILVIGRSGQVAQALAGQARDGVHLRCIGRPDVDLTNTASLAAALQTETPDIVINAAAYTSVDGAESDAEAAEALNVGGPRNLARLTRDRGIPIIQLSTDCVFDGSDDNPYTEDEPPRPLGVYGRSKLAGEQAVMAENPKHLIIRVSWIFSRFGGNFVKTMLKLAASRDVVTVVSDQFGCPTHAEDLAGGLVNIAIQAAHPDFDQWGVFHLAGRGDTQRADQARAIFSDSAAAGGPTARVNDVATADYPTPAERPLNARLDSIKTETVFGVRLPHWRERLKSCVEELVSQGDLS